MSFFISDAVAAAAPASQTPGMEGMLFPLGVLAFFYFLFCVHNLNALKKRKK